MTTTMTTLRWCRKEGAHATGHGRDDPDVPAHRGLIEVEAESAALLILAAHDVDTSQYTVPYVSTWASRVEGVDPVTAVQQTAARVRTIALNILGRLDTRQVSDGDPPGLDRTPYPGRGAPKAAARPAPVPDGLARLEPGGRHHAGPGSAVWSEGAGR